MSIRERVERDKQLEAAKGGGALSGSEVLSATADTSESSYAPSALTYNSMEPMERSELAAAAMVRYVFGGKRGLCSCCELAFRHKDMCV